MRKSGVLMHISSLPSPYGIGTLGAAAREFVDFLRSSGQSYWQVLPVSPTGYGNSPYQSFSSFAGNPYFIDFDILNEQGLLEKSDYQNTFWGENPRKVDFGAIYQNRFQVLRLAANRLLSAPTAEYRKFCDSNSFWLDNYALFMAIKNAHGGGAWTTWPQELRFRQPEALDAAKAQLEGEINFYKVQQHLFYQQWAALRAYANKNDIKIIGDIPIYVSPDSADVWSEPRWFQLDEQLLPLAVAGCPPDGFTADGQLWGNPLYKWQEHRSSGYSWWIRRIAHQFEIYDILRIDHFRGFDTYFSIPYGAENARNGHWEQGPGMELFHALNSALGGRDYIAEDLGMLFESVHKLLADSGLPGMKVLQFAFENCQESDYLPHNFIKNCVAYTGTHDNDTILGWAQSTSATELEYARKYMKIPENSSFPYGMISALWSTVSSLTIAAMQDLLELGSEARMNTPGSFENNWHWRMEANADLPSITKRLREITQLYYRI